MQTEIIQKNDDTQKIFLSENILDVTDILKTYYSYIYESIENEGFILKYDECNLFKELLYDSKVVGFCSYDFSREFITASLNNIYVLPEYRGNKIFLHELERTMAEHNKPSIMEPTRKVVELLISYGFASLIDDNIVASAIEFVIPSNHVLSNTDFEIEELSTHFYDMDKCRSIHILDINRGHVAFSSPLNHDIISYDCPLDIDEDYLSDLVDFFKENELELKNTIFNLEKSLPIKKYTLEEIIGDDDNFSHYIETLIDDAHVTYSKALEIKEQIKEEYEAGMILNESLLIRLAYLFEENKVPRIKSHEETCPYCEMPIDSHDVYCHFCGINLAYDLDEMHSSLIENINMSSGEFQEDIRFIAYKFLTLVEQKIKIDYSIFIIESTYNISWNVLNEFLMANDYFKNDEITAEGQWFLKSHPLYFWDKYHMDIVNYTDFEEYFYSHDDLSPLERCLNYLKQFDDDEDIAEIIDVITSDLDN